jgi:hypothetical protein
MRFSLLLGLLAGLGSYGTGAEAGTVAPTPPTKPAETATTTGATSEPQVVFGMLTVADDHHSVTVTVKDSPVVLAITDQTTITLDLKPVSLGALNLKESVRVTYLGTTALSIDQLKPGKKKKKKPQ